jgi:hypothetical protein
MENRPQRTDSESFVIGDYDSRMGRLTSKDYVAALLTLNNEADFRQSFDEVLPG